MAMVPYRADPTGFEIVQAPEVCKTYKYENNALFGTNATATMFAVNGQVSFLSGFGGTCWHGSFRENEKSISINFNYRGATPYHPVFLLRMADGTFQGWDYQARSVTLTMIGVSTWDSTAGPDGAWRPQPTGA